MTRIKMGQLTLTLLTLVATTFISAAASATVNEHKFRLGMTVQRDTPMGATAERFQKHLAELSEEKLALEILPGGLLGDATSLQEQVSRGVLEFSIGFVSTGLDSRLGLVNVPGIFWSWEDAKEFWQAEGDMLKVFSDVAEENGMKVLGTIPCCFNRVITSESFDPVPSDVAKMSLKSRSMSMPSDVLAVEAIGLNATPMPLNETPTALATGMLDVVAGPAMADIPMYEGLADKVYLYRYRVEINPLLMSLDIWDSLSAEEQEVIQEAANAATASGWEHSKSIMEDYKQRAGEWGIEVVELSEAQHVENIKAIRDNVWPKIEDSIGSEIMDRIRSAAVPLPKE